MSFTQTRRRFLTGLSLTGAAGVLRAPSALAAQPGLETPAVRIADLPGICIAPQYVAEELLHAEGFTDVRYVRLAPGHNTPEGIASGEVDFGVNFASVLVTGLDRGVELTVLGGVHVGCFELFVNEESRSLIELKGADHAYDAAIVYMLGTGLGVAFAALVKFAVLPQVVTYFGFSIILGFYLVPTGALIAQPRHPALFTAMAANFVPLLAPTNEMNYDTQQFYNSALAIVAGLTAATLSFRLIPPLSPASRSRRLLALTLRDLRRLATGPIPRTPADWEGHMYGRLSAMPDRAEPLQRAQLLAALSVGTKIIQLRRITQRLNLQSELDAALESIGWGDSAAAVSRLAALDKTPSGWESLIWARPPTCSSPPWPPMSASTQAKICTGSRAGSLSRSTSSRAGRSMPFSAFPQSRKSCAPKRSDGSLSTAPSTGRGRNITAACWQATGPLSETIRSRRRQ